MASGQNNTGNELTLRQITAPGLGQAGYGRHMEQTFENIDDNFKILGNRDFVKGDKGYSLRSVSIRLIEDDDVFTEDGISVIKAIMSITGVDGSFLDELTTKSKSAVISKIDEQNIPWIHSITRIVDGKKLTISMVDYINENCVINKIEIYDPANSSDSEVIGTTNDLIIKDARFVHAEDYQNVEYSGLYDYSCTVHLALLEKNGGYEAGYQILQNYPTLYYDPDQGSFCWKVFDVKTGIIAQGPKGDAGKKADMHIVCGKWTNEEGIPSLSEADIRPITQVLIDGVWEDASSADIKAKLKSWKGEACIMFAIRQGTGQNSSDPVYPFAFASTISDCGGADSGYGAYCDQANSIQMDQDAVLVRSAFLGISYSPGALLHALFVPIGEGSTFDTTPVHAIWAAPVKAVGNGVKYELHITPFKSYNEIGTVGNDLVDKDPPIDEASSLKRLKVINGHIYTPKDPSTGVQIDSSRLQLDYPQVIITGPLSDDTPAAVPTAALGIGTAYLDPLKKIDSNDPLIVPRIKVGTGGVVQIGANKDTSSKNNKGSLVVANIYSSLTGIAESDDGGCDLNLVGTSGKINIGDSTLSTENYIYGTTFLYPKANGLTLLDPDLNWTQYIAIRPNNARQANTDLRLALIVADGMDGSGLLLGKGGTGVGGVYVTDEDIRIWGSGSNHDVRIESNNPSVIMKDGLDVINKTHGRTTIGGPTDAVYSMAERIWDAGNPVAKSQSKEIIIPQTIASASNSSCSYSKEFDMSMYEGKLKGSSSTYINASTFKISVYTKDVAYARGPSTYIRSIDRTCYLRMYLDTGTETKTLVSTSSTQNIDITNAPVYASRTVECTFTWTIDKKTVDCVVSKGKKPKIRIEAWFSDSWNGSGSKGASYSDHYIKISSSSTQTERTLKLTNTGYAAGNGGGAMRTEYDNGVLLTGLYRHRNIGIYIDGRPDSAFGDNPDSHTLNGNIGIYASFLSGTNKKEIYTYIPLQDIFYKLYGFYPDQYDDGQEAHRAHLSEYS